MAAVSAGQDTPERILVSRFLHQLGVLGAASLAAVALACSGMEASTETVESTPTPVASQAPAVEPDESPRAAAPTAGYDSTSNMDLLFSGPGHPTDDSLEAIRLAVANNDKSMVPVIIEMLRFFGSWELVLEAKDALMEITGEELRPYSRGWFEWMEWLGRNADEYVPPDGYVGWKAALMSNIDFRFVELLTPAEQGARINVAEIAWGGVRTDGIPPLEQAPVVKADDQDYMLPTDRVFGVSINGQHRAYPLRIVNAHEMANDILGGEPISLAY